MKKDKLPEYLRWRADPRMIRLNREQWVYGQLEHVWNPITTRWEEGDVALTPVILTNGQQAYLVI